ncbi:MAG TPA: hypothetical protein VLW85_21865 [Myxococcales bacterium]|nr:hypothetical protein [Myxococcales bacterium]
MTFLLLLPVVLSALLQAAHLFRWLGPAGLVALVPLALLASRRRAAARALQALLVLAALEWLRAMVALVEERAAIDQPFGRLVIILGAVALFTGLSALVFQAPPLARRYTPATRE